jgi:hypothetical protein
MAGSYIESHDLVVNSELTRSQIRSFSSAVLDVEIAQEEFATVNGQTTLSLRVKAVVDIDDVRKRLKAIADDRLLQERVIRQQSQIRDLEEQVLQQSATLKDASPSSSGALRKERNIVIANIEELQNKKLAAVQRIAEEEDRVQETSKKIKEFIVLKMSRKEVDEILGPPLKSVYVWKGPLFYGELWICLEDRLGSGDYRVMGVGSNTECKPNLLAK